MIFYSFFYFTVHFYVFYVNKRNKDFLNIVNNVTLTDKNHLLTTRSKKNCFLDEFVYIYENNYNTKLT